MKKLILSLITSVAVWPAAAAETDWQTDLPKAEAQAKAEKKLVFMDFTGSDWCPPCRELEATVFTQSQFTDYARTNLVLVRVDFPNAKTQSDALKAANDALAKKFDVPGFPTLLVLKPDGTVVWRSEGKPEGGPADLIAHLDAARKK